MNKTNSITNSITHIAESDVTKINPVLGLMYYDTTHGVLKVYDGNNWIKLESSGGIFRPTNQPRSQKI